MNVKNIIYSIFILFLLNFKMYSFFKWQWDMMLKDTKSIKY